MKNLKISVLMPAYNAEKYISEAIQSILDQTFSDFEFIIIDDCSKDNTRSIIQNFARLDKRIIAIKNEKNLNIAANRNKLLGLAKGEYIVWQDADDISFIDRIQSQFDYMQKDNNIGIIGGTLEVFDENGVVGLRKYKDDDNLLHKIIFRYSPVAQPGAMVRMKCIDEVGGFDIYYPPAEDLDLSFRIGTKYKFANLNKKVIKYRESNDNSTFSRLKRMEIATISIRLKYNGIGSYKMGFIDHIYNICQYISVYIIPPKIKIKLFNVFRKYM